ncbi:MAG: UbiX family flavin prenyltransferase [Acidobacteriota bacterium]
MNPQRLVVGISGASAPIYGIRTLEMLQAVSEVETHLVLTAASERTIALETHYALDQVTSLADVFYETDDLAASISSGSFKTMGMIVTPCSISTMSCIAGCISKDLLTRAADVTLKERRPLVLMIRESPLHLGHLRRMTELAEMGATIAPPIPSFYHDPHNLEDLIAHSIGRALDVFHLELPWLERWTTPGRT